MRPWAFQYTDVIAGQSLFDFILYFHKSVRRKTIKLWCAPVYYTCTPFSHIIIIILPEILPFPPPEVTALSPISCCIVVGSGNETGWTVTPVGHGSTKSSGAMAWAAEVPKKITEIRHVVIVGFWPVSAVFYLKKRQGSCRDFLFLAIFQTWRTQWL